jgi:hypothetical protein
MSDRALEPCRSCGAMIFWRRNSRTGVSMPIDAEPSDQGKLAIGKTTYRVLSKAELKEWPDVYPRYQSHFATCRQAESWRSNR